MEYIIHFIKNGTAGFFTIRAKDPNELKIQMDKETKKRNLNQDNKVWAEEID